MPKYKIVEDVPLEYASFERIERLKLAGYATDGQIDGLRRILDERGLKMPCECKEGFRFDLVDENGKNYVFIYINLVDAICEKILKTT